MNMEDYLDMLRRMAEKDKRAKERKNSQDFTDHSR